MHTQTILKSALLAGACVIASQLLAQAPTTNLPQTAADGPNAAFVQEAGQGGMAEVELSKLALASAHSPQVRSFAETMVHDHGENNRQLATIATHENIQVPKELDDEHSQLRNRLASEHGVAFDRGLRRCHARRSPEDGGSVEIIGSNSEHRRTAHLHQKTLPVVEAHLHMAQDLKIE